MDKTSEPNTHLICQCDKLPSFLHALNQSLQIIQAYIGGCNHRLKKEGLDDKLLKEALLMIDNHARKMATMIMEKATESTTSAYCTDSSGFLG